MSGYGPSQFHSGYNLPTTVVGNHVIAIVDAFANPNVLANLNTYNAQLGPRNRRSAARPTRRRAWRFGTRTARSPRCRPVTPDGAWRSRWTFRSPTPSARTAASTSTRQQQLVRQPGDRRQHGRSPGRGGHLQQLRRLRNDCGTQPAYNHPKVAVTVSAGDSGFGVACPANQNTVVAVGGTTLNLNNDGSYNSESVWNGTGSGCSTVISAQSWQTSATTGPRSVAAPSAG